MGKYAKKRLFESCRLLRQANKLLEKVVSKEVYKELGDLPEQCQCCAIDMGNIIESYLSEGSESVHLLEQYTELIYQFSCLHITDTKAYKLLEQINECVAKLPEKIDQEMSDKLEVIFLPYKAAMWDSLESLYLAAKEDPLCNAYCIPIPYYDKNPDGSFGEIHYEGDQYPKNIEITSWEKYQIKLRLPDVTYIHNPYDNWNYVTSVHPDFYAKELKKYTEELVYIPYFVLAEIDPTDQNAIDRMKHFITTPGVIYADKVIVQSEKMRQIYRTEYEKTVLHNRKIYYKGIQHKFLSMQSPKIERIERLKNEKRSVPAEWEKLVNSSKKIVLYNTGIGTLLQAREKAIDKIEYTLEEFKKDREVVLLWRPHPLYLSTINSMHVELSERYKKIIEKYRNEAWGIYDDTADLDRALLLSDAYYGDGSSIVEIYRKLNKPILIESPYLKKKDLFYDIEFENIFLDKDELWFTAYYFNGLFKMKRNEWIPEFVGTFPNEKLDGFRLYSSILEYDNKLYFTPLRAKEIAVFDKSNGKINKISIEKLEIGYLDGYTGWNYLSAVLYGNKIIFFPHQRTAIVQYDIEKNRLSKIETWVKEIVDYKLCFPRLYAKVVIDEGIVYAPVAGSNLLQIINMESGQAKIYQIGEKGVSFGDICVINSKSYLCPLEGEEIIEWSNNLHQIIRKMKIYDTSDNIKFRSMVNYNSNLYFFPDQYNAVIQINDNGEMKYENIFNSIFQQYYEFQSPIESKYICSNVYDNELYVYCHTIKKLVRIIGSNAKVKRIGIEVNEEKNKDYFAAKQMYQECLFNEKENIIEENSTYQLGDFLTILKSSENK